MGKIVGGSAGKVLGSFEGNAKKLAGISEDDLNLEKIGNALLSVFDRIDEKEVIEKLNVLLSSVSMNGETLDVDHAVFEAD